MSSNRYLARCLSTLIVCATGSFFVQASSNQVANQASPNQAQAQAQVQAALPKIPMATGQGHLQVRPTFVAILANQRAGILNLINTGNAPVSAQISVLNWSQATGSDVFTPTRDFLISPAVLQVPAGQTRVVRFLKPLTSANSPSNQDQVFRVVVEQLPNPNEKAARGISVRMRYTMPMYIKAANATPGNLDCKAEGSTLSCSNSGGQAVQIGATKVSSSAGEKVASTGLLGYVLPGQTRKWPKTIPERSSGQLSLITKLNGTDVTLPVTR